MTKLNIIASRLIILMKCRPAMIRSTVKARRCPEPNANFSKQLQQTCLTLYSCFVFSLFCEILTSLMNFHDCFKANEKCLSNGEKEVKSLRPPHMQMSLILVAETLFLLNFAPPKSDGLVTHKESTNLETTKLTLVLLSSNRIFPNVVENLSV